MSMSLIVLLTRLRSSEHHGALVGAAAIRHHGHADVHLFGGAGIDDGLVETRHGLAIARSGWRRRTASSSRRNAVVDGPGARGGVVAPEGGVAVPGDRELVVQEQRRIQRQAGVDLLLAGRFHAGVVAADIRVPALAGAGLDDDVGIAQLGARRHVDGGVGLAAQTADVLQGLVQVALVQLAARPGRQGGAPPAGRALALHRRDTARHVAQRQRAGGQRLLGDQHARGDTALVDEPGVQVLLQGLRPSPPTQGPTAVAASLRRSAGGKAPSQTTSRRTKQGLSWENTSGPSPAAGASGADRTSGRCAARARCASSSCSWRRWISLARAAASAGVCCAAEGKQGTPSMQPTAPLDGNPYAGGFSA